MVGIYKITSPSGKVYIGQSRNIRNRVYYYQTLNCKRQKFLYNSLLKYGWESHIFEICHELPDDICQKVLNTYEVLYWDLYRSSGINMLNIKEPGSNGRHSEETICKIKVKRSQQIITQEHKDRISNSLIGITRPKGRKQTIETSIKIKETKDKRALERGGYFSEETNRKRGESCRITWQNKKLKNI